MRYDTEKGTEYTHLLDVYLKHERNIADTIRETYMHRNTFLYRIKRITEILNMNLDDPQIRLVLRMAFEILRQNSRK